MGKNAGIFAIPTQPSLLPLPTHSQFHTFLFFYDTKLYNSNRGSYDLHIPFEFDVSLSFPVFILDRSLSLFPWNL